MNTQSDPARIRDIFNRQAYSDLRHKAVCRSLAAKSGDTGYKLGELPIFLTPGVVEQMKQAGDEIIAQVMSPDVQRQVESHVPERFRLHNAPAHPAFMLVDFALTQDDKGDIAPRLIEIQAAAAHYAWLAEAAETYKEVYGLTDDFNYRLSADTRTDYFQQLRETIIGDHDPKHVVMAEIDPWHQDSRMDFAAMKNLFGIQVMDIADIQKKGRELYYTDEGGCDVKIERIYSRVVTEEFDRKEVASRMQFSFSEPLDVEWVGDPTWQLRISKAVLPYIDHPMVPKSRFLSDVEERPQDLDKYVLKPLFAYGGKGVILNVTPQDIEDIPASERKNWLLMEKVTFANFMETPKEGVKTAAEVRLLYTWNDKDGLQPAIMMGRMLQGQMANLAYNKKKFLGLSPVFFVDENRAFGEGACRKAPRPS